jgi:hypothetical protein
MLSAKELSMETLVVRYSKKFKNLYYAIAFFCIVSAAIMGYLVFILEKDTFIGKLVIFWCVSTAIIAAVATRLSVFTISEAGLKCVSGRPIPWDEIQEVSIGTILRSKRLFIKFVNPRRFTRKRLFFWFWQLLFAGDEDDFFMPLGGLELKPEEICSIIQKRLETRQTNQLALNKTDAPDRENLRGTS